MRKAVSMFVLLLLVVGGALADTEPTEGLRDERPTSVALVGAKIVVSPDRSIDSGTILIRDGKITAVGPDVEIPAGVRQIDLKGKTVYPGFIDSYTKGTDTSDAAGPGYWNNHVAPQRKAAEWVATDAGLNKVLRSQGIAARVVAPTAGILQGQAAVVLTSDVPAARGVVRESVAQCVRLTVPFQHGRRSYPSSPMGAIALARQAMLDAEWYEQALGAVRAEPSLPRPELNLALAAISDHNRAGGLWLAEVSNETHALRADRFAREFSLRLAIVGAGNEYRRLEEIAETGRVVIVPLDFPKPPEVATKVHTLHVSLEELMHWRLAPENPGRLAERGVTIAFSSEGLGNRGEFLAQIRKAVERGLAPEAALEGLTLSPARLLGLEEQLGSIEPGKLASLVVTDGELFDKQTKLVATWVAGVEHKHQSEPIAKLQGKWELRLRKGVAGEKLWRLSIEGTPEKPTAKIEPVKQEEVDKKTEEAEQKVEANQAAKDQEKKSPEGATLKPLSIVGHRLSGAFDTKPLGGDGRVVLWGTLRTGGEQESLTGHLTLADGGLVTFIATRVEGRKEPEEEEDDNEKERDQKEESGKEAKKAAKKIAKEVAVEVNYPFGAYGLTEAPEGEWVAFTGATVWTCGAEGILKDATVVVKEGKIVAVGTDLEVPEGAKEIPCEGKHLTPGIIDCHSHMATDGGINEVGQAVTAEVRIGDTIDCDDIHIYYQLAGGVTTANVLHGSANPIGGQNQVIKLRWGATAEEMKFEGAPAGIKFALGENVKQSNWGARATGRYPQSRMGVDELMIDRFQAAKEYRENQQRWERSRRGLPPRRDLELEAIAEILEKKRLVHCHSYRQSEILALLRTLESFDVQVGSLQHILEGYKLAPELAEHGAMASSFSDWWGYKFEVYDAIPHNGALLHRAGVVVSFNSDDLELARLLNLEAAKATKYGGVEPEEALKFVTLNPARQLRIDAHVGSIEVGKHADLVVWSGPPMSSFSRCEQTWIDGRRYFDRDTDAKLRQRDAKLHAELVQAVLASGEPTAQPGENRVDTSPFWPRYDEYCAGQDHGLD